ncbi:MAG TPA: aldehyde dehydrogenase [Acidimicrobiales bacterium]|jgi:betaine-aldehyde dehydrogenase|nr:aldehyde dehydrogenase [Acidimicrobiales bacterium]
MAIRDYDRLYIGGDWVAPEGTDTIGVISPVSEEVIAHVPDGTEADIDKAVAAARIAFDRGPWPRMAPAERGEILRKAAGQIMAETADLAEIITKEMGAPITFSNLGQVMAPMMIFNYYADLAGTFAFDEVRDGLLNPKVLVTKEPVGVVGAIAPWNVPLFIAAAKLAPSLAAGCAVVYKPAPETPLDAFRLAEIFEECGLPKGVLSVVPAGREVSEHLVTHPGVDKISFTGSGVGGKRIGGLCGERLKRCTLELGGKSAAIILDDADLATTIPTLLPNAIMNNGQACIAQTRILAPRARYGEVVDAVVSGVSAMKVGDPMDPATEVGPVVAERQRTRIEGYLDSGREEGATVAIGGGRPGGSDFAKGWYVEPTVFSDVDNKMKIAQEEIFGPVLVVIPYDGDDNAVEIANDSNYGLCGSVWTNDNDRGLGIARQVRTGTYMLNSFAPIDFATPFGGFKESGVGREFGPEGLESFLEKKSIGLPADYTPGTGS